MQKKNKGFTLIELLVVIALIGILSAVAVPSLQRWSRTMGIQQDSRDILSAIKVARTKAITLNVPVTFSLHADTHTYSLVDSGGNVLLRGSFRENTTISANTLGSSVQFNTRGIANTSGNVTLDNGTTHKTIAVYITGSARILSI